MVEPALQGARQQGQPVQLMFRYACTTQSFCTPQFLKMCSERCEQVCLVVAGAFCRLGPSEFVIPASTLKAIIVWTTHPTPSTNWSVLLAACISFCRTRKLRIAEFRGCVKQLAGAACRQGPAKLSSKYPLLFVCMLLTRPRAARARPPQHCAN